MLSCTDILILLVKMQYARVNLKQCLALLSCTEINSENTMHNHNARVNLKQCLALLSCTDITCTVILFFIQRQMFILQQSNFYEQFMHL